MELIIIIVQKNTNINEKFYPKIPVNEENPST